MVHCKQRLSQKKEQENTVSVKQKKSHYATNKITKVFYLSHVHICYTYTTGSSALPDIYAHARGLVRVYQAKHECLWYKCYVPHCLCRLIARQYELEHWIYYIDSSRKFNYGPAHASSNHVIPTFVNKNR